jgi:hypothetical protein
LFNAFYISYPKLKEKSFLDLEKNALSMHVLKERYVKKCGKDICGSEFYTVVSFCSKHNIFSKKDRFTKAKSALKTSINIGLL